MAYEESRKLVCNTCEHNGGWICNKCYCILPIKIRIASSTCPLDKWGAVKEEENVDRPIRNSDS